MTGRGRGAPGRARHRYSASLSSCHCRESKDQAGERCGRATIELSQLRQENQRHERSAKTHAFDFLQAIQAMAEFLQGIHRLLDL